MAKTTEITRVVGNRGRAFGSYRKTYSRAKHRSNTGGEILAYNLASGNPGRRKGTMARTKKRRMAHKRPNTSHRRHIKTKRNPGHRRRRNTGAAVHHRRYRRNPGLGSVGPLITNAAFTIIGALGSKLGAQLVLGTGNTGVMGYGANIGVGLGLWFLAEKVMKNRAAATGILAGTAVQVILRAINDFTPFGTYVANLGMGDYQVQAYVVPQVLIDPTNSADIRIPSGWGAPAIPAPMPSSSGMKGISVYDGAGASY